MADDGAPQMPATGNLGVGDWVTAFSAQRKRVEQGIRERLSTDDRAVRLADADAALPDVDLSDADSLQLIADLLEAKLQEMLAVILSNGDLDRGVRLPRDFTPGPDLDALCDELHRDERLWLFKGGVQEILYRFRDQGNALVLEERNRLLRSLSASVRRMKDVVSELNAHPVVAQAFETDEVARIEQTLEAAQAVASRYASVLTSREAGVAPLLEDNYYQLQGQFTAACAQLCLEIYGNVSNLHLCKLLDLKALYLLDVLPSDAPEMSLTEAERKHLERKRDWMLKRVMSRAKKESWPTWPILQLYNYDKRFGRLPPKTHHRQHDEGLTSAEMPTNRAGMPLAGGW
jgi:hypothetical protein